MGFLHELHMRLTKKHTLLDELKELKAPPGYVPSPEKIDLDALYPKAVEVVFEKRDPSVEVLKAELGLGYANAARLIDRTAAEGIVSDYVSGKGRRILIAREEWQKSGTVQGSADEER